MKVKINHELDLSFQYSLYAKC